MVPCLHVLADGRARASREAIAAVADRERLSEEARGVVMSSGYLQHVNRISWALSYLYRAAAVQRPSRGVYVITDVGRSLLEAHPSGLTEKTLRTVPGYRTPRTSAAAPPVVTEPVVTEPIVTELVVTEPGADDTGSVELDPVEQIEAGITRIHEDVAAELLARLHSLDPAFFEQAVLDLLMGMGYGGADGTATRTQLSNDGGIDGVIDQDALGLNRVYVQAKRYALDAAVGRPEIQGFVGALQGRQTNHVVELDEDFFL